MQKLNVLAAALTILAFLSIGFFQPVQAQHKPIEQGGKRLKMMQKQPQHGMPMKNRAPKTMGMAHHSKEHMTMMADPILRTLHNFGCPGFLLENAGALALTDQQKETLTNLKNEFKKVAIQTNADIKVATVDMKQAMSQEQPDYNKVTKSMNTIEQLKKQLHEKFFNTLKNARKVLTDEQLKKLKDLAQTGPQRRMRMEEMEEEMEHNQ